MSAQTPDYLSPYEKALRALILIGTYGLPDLSNAEINLSLDGMLTVSVPDIIDIEKAKTEKKLIKEIVGYAESFSISTPSKSLVFTIDGAVETQETADTGTVSSMRVPAHDAHDMLVSLRKITAIIEALSGHALNDLVPVDEAIRAFPVGSGSWENAEDDSVYPVEFFLARTGSPDERFFQTVATMITGESVNLGVFDGKWYYPANVRRGYGSETPYVWTADAKIAVVPYGSFDGKIPTGGSQRGNAVDGASLHASIAAAMPSACAKTTGSAIELAKAANWFAQGAHDMLVELGLSRYRGALAMSGNILEANSGSVLSMPLDMSVLEEHPGYAISDLMNTPQVTCFHIAVKNGVAGIDKGPYVTEDNDLSRAVAMGIQTLTSAQLKTLPTRVSRAHYTKTTSVFPYSEASGRTCADTVYAENFVPAGEIKYAAKKLQNLIDGLNTTLTPVYPAGLAMIRIKNHETDIDDYSPKRIRTKVQRPQFAATVIVDTSRRGVKSARLAANELFATSGVNAGEGLLVCMLPKDADGTPWSDDERSEMEHTLVELAKMSSSNVSFVSADKLDAIVDAATSKTKAARSSGKLSEAKVREEIRKMCSGAIVINIEGGKPVQNKPYRTSGATGEVYEKILKNPAKWAVAVLESDYEVNYATRSWASNCVWTMLALGFLPKGVEHICCVDAGHYNAKRAKMISEIGIAILYDNSGKAANVSAAVPAEWFSEDPLAAGGSANRNQVMDFRTYSTTITYSGPVPENLEDAARSYEELRLAGRLYDELARRFENNRKGENRSYGRRVSAYAEDVRNMNMFVDKMSYGMLSADLKGSPTDEIVTSGVPDDVEKTLEPWKAKSLSAVVFANTRLEVERERCENIVGKFADICAIWKAKLEEGAGMTFDISKVGSWNADTFQGVGSACGIDTAIEAYFAGVPLEDLLM